MQRQLLALLAFAAALLSVPATGHADEQVAIIVSSQMTGVELDETTLRAIYLKKVFLDSAGESLIPVNLPPDNPLRQAFAQSVIHLGELQLRNYWNRRYFQGVSPPYVLGSQKAVIRFIASTPGAVGYVSPCFVDSSVQTVLLMNVPETRTDEVESCPPSPGA
jgi:hypothetical protein